MIPVLALALVVYPPGTNFPAIDPATWTADMPARAVKVTGSQFYSIVQAQRAFAFEGFYASYAISVPSPGTMRFEVHHGDKSPFEVSTGHPFDRDEISSRELVTTTGRAVRINYLFSLDPGPVNTASWMVVGQLRQDMPVASPAFEIHMVGDVMGATVRTDDGKGGWTNNVVWTDSAPLIRGQRYRMQIDATPSVSNGEAKLTRDGVVRFDYHGPISFNAEKGLTWSEGVYRYGNALEVQAVRFGALNIVNPK